MRIACSSLLVLGACSGSGVYTETGRPASSTAAAATGVTTGAPATGSTTGARASTGRATTAGGRSTAASTSAAAANSVSTSAATSTAGGGSLGTPSSTAGGRSSDGSSTGTTAATSTASGTTGGGNSGSGGTLPAAGNPDGSCTTLSLPAEAQPVDTSHPTAVVGDGTADSCTFAALQSAVNQGGTITFDCGDGLVTIPVTSTLTPPVSSGSQPPLQIVIDGGDKITLDGQSSVRIFSWVHDTWRTSQDTLTLQHLQVINGKATPTQAIPACPASGNIPNTACSQGYDDGEGGALYMQDGSLRVIDCTFDNNQAAPLGPDTGGGALYLYGTGVQSYVAQSTFQDNTASNAGAIGMLWAGAFIFNSLFTGNSAVGTGANNNDPTQCTCINAGQNEIGSGGNGGAIYKDGGDGVNLTICGTQIAGNSANEFGAAVFLTADGSSAQLVLDDSLLKDNTSPISYWNWCLGVSTDNPHASGSSTSSPSPVDTSFCASESSCSSTCSS